MSYFSDTSSASSSTLPITPSTTRRLPSPIDTRSAESLDGSSPLYAPYLTPPPSLRLYSSALKAKMAAGMTAAMRDLKGEQPPERKFDAEYGFDEDPIERHVRLYLTPRTATRPSGPRPSYIHQVASDRPISAPPAAKGTSLRVTMDVGEERAEYDVNFAIERTPRTKHDFSGKGMLVSSPSTLGQSASASDDKGAFKPGLLQFSSFHSNSYLMPPRPDAYRMDSTTSTASSVASEASFEAIRAEDMVSLYGGPVGVKRAEGPFSEDGEERSLMSDTTYRPIKTPKLTPTSTIHGLSLSPLSTMANHSHSLLPAADLAGKPPPSSQPIPHRRPVDLGLAGTVSDDGGEEGSIGGRLGVEIEPVWLKDRTLSERMVLEAGLTTQKQRANVRRR